MLSLYTIQAAGFVSLNIALIPVALLAMLLGGLLYLTYTRPDISAEVVLLQTKINVATVAELRQCNATIKRAHSGSSLGLV